MTAYCAKADLVERFGLPELAQLTDETAAATPDDAEITKACDEAASLIDGYVAGRYAVPLSPVPTMVRMWACAIARKILWKDRALPESAVAVAYESALEQLKDVAKGVMRLPDSSGSQADGSDGAFTATSRTLAFGTDFETAYL